jgi:hypothetical protein
VKIGTERGLLARYKRAILDVIGNPSPLRGFLGLAAGLGNLRPVYQEVDRG